MNRHELRQRLQLSGIRDDAFSFGENPDDESYVIAKQLPTGWLVYYSERGLRSGELLFGSEDEACAYVYKMLCADPTARS